MSGHKPGRGIYLLPNLITASSLLSGFFAAIKAFDGHFEVAAIALLVCVVLDSLDGNVARLTRTTSRFGAEFDSLTDVVVFGCIPALIIHQWSLATMADLGWLWAKLGWLAAFFYTVATALRLARFNARITSSEKSFFRGLPCPAAATLVMSFVWLSQETGYSGSDVAWWSFALMVLAGAAMVSNFSYYSLQGINLKSRVPFIALLAVVAGLIVAAIDLPKFLFFLALLYIASGPLLYGLRLARKSLSRRRNTDENLPNHPP